MDNQIKQLAETLQKTGIAASMYEAIEKAKSILKVNIQKPENSEENTQNIQQNQETIPNIGAEIKEDTTLNELMKEVNVSPEEVKEQEQKKIEGVQEEVNVIKETQDPQQNKTEQKDMFAEEKKIDLTKIFGNKR